MAKVTTDMFPVKKRKITITIMAIITTVMVMGITITIPRMVGAPLRTHLSRKLKTNRTRLRKAFQAHHKLCKRWVKSKRLARKTTIGINSRVHWWCRRRWLKGKRRNRWPTNDEIGRRRNAYTVELAHQTGVVMTARMIIRLRQSANWKTENWTRIAKSISGCMVMEGTTEIGTKSGTTMIGREGRGVVACPVVLPAHHKECGVECSKMEEGAVVLIRTIGGIVETGLVTINGTDTTITIDTRHQTITAIIEIGIEVIDPTRISEVGTRPIQEVIRTIITACLQVITILRVIILIDTQPVMTGVEDPRVGEVVVQEATLWTTEVVVVAVVPVVSAEAVEDEETTKEGRHLPQARSLQERTLKMIQ